MDEYSTYRSFDPGLSVSEQIRAAGKDLRHDVLTAQARAHGAPVSYASMDTQPAMLRQETQRSDETYVSFDEAHAPRHDDVTHATDSLRQKRQMYSYSNKDSNSGETYAGYSDDGIVSRSFAHHDVTTSAYDQHSQDWIIPRRIMCAFFWVGIILLFTGIVLMVTSKHQDDKYVQGVFRCQTYHTKGMFLDFTLYNSKVKDALQDAKLWLFPSYICNCS